MKKHKRRYILTILVSSVALCFVAAALYGIYDTQQKESLRRDIQTTHLSLKTISADLKGQQNAVWADVSECYHTTPRQFGEEDKYSCDVVYTLTGYSVTLGGFDQLRQSTKVKGKLVNFSQKSEINEHTSYTAQLPGYEDVDNCSLRYEYDEKTETLYGALACYYSLTKKQFDAVSGVLKTGPDRT